MHSKHGSYKTISIKNEFPRTVVIFTNNLLVCRTISVATPTAVADMSDTRSPTIAGTSGQAQNAGDSISDGSSAHSSRSSEESNAARFSRDWSSDHPVNIRFSIPLPFSRFYVTLVMGRERRNPQRRVRDSTQHPLRTNGNVTFLLVAGTIVGIALFTIVQVVGVWVLSQTGWVVP